MLLINSETVADKQFLKSVSTGLHEFMRFNISWSQVWCPDHYTTTPHCIW